MTILAEAEKYKRMGEIAYMAEKQHEAFAFMRTHPGDTLNFMFRRFVENWLGITDTPADIWSHVPLYAKSVHGHELPVFFVVACLELYSSTARDTRNCAFPFAMVLLVFPLVFYMTHSSLRYRFPMDPIMMVLASGALAHLLSLARSRKLGKTANARAGILLPTN